MQKLSYDLILDIQRKVNIVDVIGKYLPLVQKGKNYFAICPFHDDHNPSMSISFEKQIYTCFVCGASGNVFNFIMNYEKVSFNEAVKIVAKEAKIDIDYDAAPANKSISKYDKYYKMFDITNKYYQNNLRSVYGKSALSYLKKRSITDDIIKEFGIGLSLNDNSVSKLLINKGYQKDELIDIGLCGAKNNYMFDIFRNRIMFPLYDLTGQVIGFSGRIYNGEDDSKYVNSKESVIFKKGRLLYNYHNAINVARKQNQIIIVEGFMDVIRLSSIDIKNVVATMGTAITKEHAHLIKKLSKNVVLCFDGDKAGEKATLSALKELEEIGLDPKIIRLEDNFDPDDYILKKGKEKFLNHLNNLKSSISFKLEVERLKTNFNDYGEVSNYLKEVVKELRKIKDNVVYELTVKNISKETGVDVKTINDMVKRQIEVENEKIKIIDKRKVSVKNKYVKAEEYLIYYMLRKPSAIMLYQNKVSYLQNRLLSNIAMEILEFYEKKGYINVTDFTCFLEDKNDLINEVLRIDGLNLPEEVSDLVIDDYIKTIDDGLIDMEKEKIKAAIKKETSPNEKIILLEKLASLKKKECK